MLQIGGLKRCFTLTKRNIIHFAYIYILGAERCFERDIGWSKQKKRKGLCIDSKAHADSRRNYIKKCVTSL